MRTLLTLSLAAACLLSLPANARVKESGPPPLSAKRVTLSRHDAPLEKVLKELFAGSGEHYSVSRKVAELQLKVDAELADVPFDEALRRVLEAARRQSPNLTAYRLLTGELHGVLSGNLRSSQKRSYSIRLRTSTGGADAEAFPRGSELPGLEQRVSLDVRDVPLRQAVERALGPGSIVNLLPGESPALPHLEIESGIPDVLITLRYQGVTPDTAVSLIAAAVSTQTAGVRTAAATTDSQDYVLRRVTDPEQLDAIAKTRDLIADLLNRPVQVDYRQIDLRTLVANVTTTFPGLSTTLVEREVPHVPVTVRVDARNAEEALGQVLAAASSAAGFELAYTRAGMFFAVHRRR